MCVLTNIETHQCYQKWKKLLKNHQDERVSTLGNSVWRGGREKDKKEWQLLFVLLQSNMHKELSEIRRKSQLRTQEKIMKCL